MFRHVNSVNLTTFLNKNLYPESYDHFHPKDNGSLDNLNFAGAVSFTPKLVQFYVAGSYFSESVAVCGKIDFSIHLLRFSQTTLVHQKGTTVQVLQQPSQFAFHYRRGWSGGILLHGLQPRERSNADYFPFELIALL